MKKIIILLLSLLICSLFSSCNTTKRAEKRIYNIVEDHPELVLQDTVKIDTVLTVKPAADSVILAFDEVVENQTKEISTNEGCFAITILPSREGAEAIEGLKDIKVKIKYLPDSISVPYRKNIPVEKIVVEKPRELWRDILLYAIIVYVFCLIVKTLIEKILK